MEEEPKKVDISEEIEKTAEPPAVTHEVAVKEEQIAEKISHVPITPVRRDVLEERKDKFVDLIKSPKIWVIGLLIIALILGIYIRSMPMHDHGGGTPGLWDVATNTWTLGPDLDPWLFLRTAESIVEEGGIPEIDHMRNVPLGFENAKETRLLPYMIAATFYISKLVYSGTNIEFAGAVFPVIMFALTILAFFLFVRETFRRETKKSKTKANLIAIISTFFMIVIPVFLSRTVAGIPEKESAGFFFMFLSFYLFLKAWKSKGIRSSAIFGILAGLATAGMGLIWGGVLFIYIAIAGATLIAFVLNKVGKGELVAYGCWILVAIFTTLLLSSRSSLKVLLTSLSSGLAFIILCIIIVHFILWNTKLSNSKILRNTRIPKTIFSLIVAGILLLLLSILFFGPGFIIEKGKAIHQNIFKPVTGRWNTTVAENRQPYFTEWAGSFGPFIKGIPIMFWMFFIGAVALFKKALRHAKKRDSWILTGAFVLLLCGMIFSRYSSSSPFNGENFISKLVYYAGVFIFLWLLMRIYYKKYYKNHDNAFEKVDYENMLLFVLLLLSIFSARGAVRLIMVLGPIAPIFASFLIVESIYAFRKSSSDRKVVFAIIMIVLLLLGLFAFWGYYKTIKVQAYNHVPSAYNQQWQRAMEWVRDNTSEDAVFAHWWDYGYWVQSIGKRATVLDGGNTITFWNYYMGRLVLTGDNQKDSLDFLYNHDADYLLIDPTDIGKYGAYSSIGSDENFDRFSWIPIMVSDTRQTRETNESLVKVYSGGSVLDEDLIYDDNGSETFLPAQKAAIAGVILELNQGQGTLDFKQPQAVYFYNGKQIQLPLRYLGYREQFYDFGTGVEGAVKVLEKVDQGGTGIKIDNTGALIYISPRVLRGYFGQKYLLHDPFEEFENFDIAYQQESFVVEGLRVQGLGVDEFVYFQGVQGPIKIWEIEYTGNEKEMPEYLDKNASKYLSWKL